MDSKRRETVRSYFDSATSLRPIMTSLNGDNSWLMSFPRPQSDREKTGKAYYHIVFEPWLKGATTIVGWWFIKLELPVSPGIPTVEAIEAVIKEIEDAAASFLSKLGRTPNTKTPDSTENSPGGVDALLIVFHYADHLHPATLLTFNPNIPVIASPEAAKILSKLKHFKSISRVSNYNSDQKSWRSPELHPGPAFPSWLTPLRFPGDHELNYILALVCSHTHDPDAGEEAHEVMFQSPHGTLDNIDPLLQSFIQSSPKVSPLAMLHGLKESFAAGSQNTFGVTGGLRLFRRVGGVKYWLLTHHSSLAYSGVMMWLLHVNDKVRTLDWGLEKEKKEGAGEGAKPNLVTVENGGCFVLG